MGEFIMEINKINNGIENYNKNKSNDTENINKKIGTKKVDKNINIDNNSDIKRYSEKDVKDAADILNKLLEKNKSHIEIEKHDVFNDIIIKIIDDKTGDIIREIPPKKILDMVAQMCKMVGVILDKKA